MTKPAAAMQARTILLIEDEPSVSAFIRATLERRGYSVVLSPSGAEGVRELCAQSFAGVISDIRMPGSMNGAELHQWIRQNRPNLAAHVLLISGDTANSDTQAFLEKTGTPCIEKPFRVEQLVSAVEKIMGKP